MGIRSFTDIQKHSKSRKSIIYLLAPKGTINNQ